MSVLRTVVVLFLCLPPVAMAGTDSIMAIGRSNGVNFKDRALAACVAAAYQGSPAGSDADMAKSAFLEWTYYDDEQGNAEVDRLIAKYLHRDYGNPTEGYAGAKFDLLKCIDMYHSRELDQLVQKHVPHPDWRGDKPASRKRR